MRRSGLEATTRAVAPYRWEPIISPSFALAGHAMHFQSQKQWTESPRMEPHRRRSNSRRLSGATRSSSRTMSSGMEAEIEHQRAEIEIVGITAAAGARLGDVPVEEE